MKTLIVLLASMVVTLPCYGSMESGRYSDVTQGPGGGLSMASASYAIPATGILTEIMHKNAVLNDSALTGATDVQLLDLEEATVFYILITTGTYGISFKPWTGGLLSRVPGYFLDANDEVDLSSTEGHLFRVEYYYSASESDWVCQITAERGSTADGGAS